MVKGSAFLLHQATERYYHAAILVSRDTSSERDIIELLGSSRVHALLVAVLPKTEPTTNTCLICSKAYIDARYSMSYRITAEELAELQRGVLVLADGVRAACLERSRRSAERTRSERTCRNLRR